MTLREATILVVDDEPVLRTTFAIVLRQLGATVCTAANGFEALELLALERVDAMLIDRHMPQMNGRALLETLHERGMSVPSILFVSGGSEQPHELLRWGVVQTATKPLHPAQLKSLLEELLLGLPQPA